MRSGEFYFFLGILSARKWKCVFTEIIEYGFLPLGALFYYFDMILVNKILLAFYVALDVDHAAPLLAVAHNGPAV